MQNHGEPSPTQSQSSVAQTKKFAAEVPPFLMTLDSAAGGREEEEIGGVKAGMGGGDVMARYDDSDSCDT